MWQQIDQSYFQKIDRKEGLAKLEEQRKKLAGAWESPPRGSKTGKMDSGSA